MDGHDHYSVVHLAQPDSVKAHKELVSITLLLLVVCQWVGLYNPFTTEKSRKVSRIREIQASTPFNYSPYLKAPIIKKK